MQQGAETPLAPYLRQLVQPFPQATEILDELRELCAQSKEINKAEGLDELLSTEESTAVWEQCENLLLNITQRENTSNASRSTSTNVTIGTRRVLHQPPTEKANIPWTLDQMEELTLKIERFIDDQCIEPRTAKSLSKSFPAKRARAQTTTTLISNQNPEFGIFQLKSMETREETRKRHLSVCLESLVDESPQEKLLRVFSKQARQTRKSSNPWKQYISMVSAEPVVCQTARQRRSIRYGDRNTMNSFLRKRKSLVDLKSAINSKEDLKLILERLPDPPSPPTVKKKNSVMSPREIQVCGPRRIEFQRQIAFSEDVRGEKPNKPPKPTRMVDKVKSFNPSLENLPKESVTSSPSLRRRLTLNCKQEDSLRLQEMINTEESAKKSPSEQTNDTENDKKEEPKRKGNVSGNRSNIPLKRSISRSRNATTGSPVENEQNNWREELRSAWDEEITSMSTTKRAWYKKDSPQSFLSLRGRMKKQSDKDLRSREKILKALVKYKSSLDKEFLGCGMSIRALRLKEKEHRRSAKEEILKYQSWHNENLFRAYRAYIVAKLLCIREEIAYHDSKSLLINQSIRKTKQCLAMVQAMDPSKPIPPMSTKAFAVEATINTTSMNKMRDNIKERQKHQKRMHKEYSAILKAQGIYLTTESRQQRLQHVIQSLQAHSVVNTFHEYEEITQDTVDSILLDQRCRTGQKILKLWEAIKGTEINEIPPHEIVDFLQDFVDQTATEFAIPDELLDRLRLCVGRAVYPVIFSCLWEYQAEENEFSDVKFMEQQEILRKVPPGKLDSVLEPFCDDMSLFEEGISILEDLVFQIVPSDMLMVLYRTMEHIHSIGQSKLAGDLGADDLFPMWLYITVHANISRLHSHLCYMEHFSTPEESMTQFGYCLTTFQACVAHISSVDTSKFDD